VSMAKSLLDQRDAFGTVKYGTTLLVPNGRNFAVDVMEECSDAANYGVGAAYQDWLLRNRLDALAEYLDGLLPIIPAGDRPYARAQVEVSRQLIKLTGGIPMGLALKMGW
jgi:hypothetical protein